MSDEDLIRQADGKFIRNPFKHFCDAYTTSNSSIQAKEAEQIFQNAVKAPARNARDRALAILSNENPSDPLEINSDITKTTINPK
jgi:hypothetical protein